MEPLDATAHLRAGCFVYVFRKIELPEGRLRPALKSDDLAYLDNFDFFSVAVYGPWPDPKRTAAGDEASAVAAKLRNATEAIRGIWESPALSEFLKDPGLKLASVPEPAWSKVWLVKTSGDVYVTGGT